MVIVYHNHNPLEHSLFPPCIFYRITGYQCPGCGAQRAVHYFLNGEFLTSFKMNPLLWVAVPYVAVVFVLKSPWLSSRYSALRESFTGLWASVSWLVAILLFGVLRNVF